MGIPADTSPPPSVGYDPAEELAVGTVIGDYQVEKMIGFGGMGIVYGAVHAVIGKRAAIKVLSAKYCADRAAVARFLQEAQSVNRVAHANIVDIFAFGTLDDGRSYLIMEWLQGESLSARLERAHQLPVHEVIEITTELTRALEAAHAANVIHRDLKPDNVIVIPDDDGFRIKLLDFGIAKLSTSQPQSSKTATGITMGTPLFMSPEQARGQNVDARTDIYALGIMMYAMLCGETPFEHEASPVEVLHAHIGKTPRPPSTLRAEVPEAIDALVLQLLSKQPEDRPTLGELRTQLRLLDGSDRRRRSGVVSVPAHETEDVRVAPVRRRRMLLAGGGAFAAAAIAFVVVMSQRGGTTPASTTTTVASTLPPADQAPGSAATAMPARQPEPPPRAVGTISLSIEPKTATITMDGKPITLAQGSAQIEAESGNHAVTIRAPGYHSIEQMVAIVPSQVTPVNLKLQRLRPAKQRPTTAKPPRGADTDAVVNPFDKRKHP